MRLHQLRRALLSVGMAMVLMLGNGGAVSAEDVIQSEVTALETEQQSLPSAEQEKKTETPEQPTAQSVSDTSDSGSSPASEPQVTEPTRAGPETPATDRKSVV